MKDSTLTTITKLVELYEREGRTDACVCLTVAEARELLNRTSSFSKEETRDYNEVRDAHNYRMMHNDTSDYSPVRAPPNYNHYCKDPRKSPHDYFFPWQLR